MRPIESSAPCLFLAKEKFYHYFFTSAARQELENVFPNFQQIKPDYEDPGLLDRLREANPEILITGWSTPRTIKPWIDQ